MIDAKYLLSDEQMREFITRGYLVLKTDFPPEFHQRIYQKLEEIYEHEGNPGNNIIPRIPELKKVYEHPVIRGALTSVLGPEYMIQPHRHCHFNRPEPGFRPGGFSWHKDSYWGHYKMRNHHQWSAMLFYYNQDVTFELGASSVKDGTQFYENLHFDNDDLGNRVVGKAGTFALIHYDLWHRATQNVADRNRYMLKLQFMRMKAPERPSWNNVEKEWVTPSNLDGILKPHHQVVWREMWNWLCGNQSAAPSVKTADASRIGTLIDALKNEDASVRLRTADELGLLGAQAVEATPALKGLLTDPDEAVALNAAYALGAMGREGGLALIDALHACDNQLTSRLIGYGLSSAGGLSVVPELTEALAIEDVFKRGCVAFALGELGATAQPAIPALAGLVTDSSEWVRRNVVEALGIMGPSETVAVPALLKALVDNDDQVRFTALLSIGRIGSSAKAAIPALTRALEDENRYVRAYAADALNYIGTDEAKEILIDYLLAARWCPSTTKASTF